MATGGNLTDADFAAIYKAIEEAIPQSEVVYGKVIKRDVAQGLVWLDEFGDQPIPLVGFNGEVHFYDTTPTGVKLKKAKIVHQVPKKGQTVVVLRQLGSRRLPKCVGVVLSKGSFVI